MKHQVHAKKKDGIGSCLLLLTIFFMMLEISFFISCNKAYLSDISFISHHLQVPISILPGILGFLAAQILIHAIFYLFILGITYLIFAVLNLSSDQRLYTAMAVWTLAILFILTANQVYFPNSKITELTGLILFNKQLAQIAFIILLGFSSMIILLAIMSLLNLLLARKKIAALMICTTSVCLFAFTKSSPLITSISAANEKYPNIIIVGIDSLRPDFLSYFGAYNATPFLDNLLNQSTVFAEAITPLARTFPSWMGILSGQYPRELNVRSNLAPQQSLDLQHTLPAILKHHGYETIYATDETRFSNIDKNAGFDQIITPPIGLNDFLLGTFNDFPLSNLIVNTWLGQYLFPYSYGNRPVYFTYDPNSFLNLLKPMLSSAHNKPLFLAVHFCLPHNPYLWAALPGREYDGLARYAQSITRVDKQVSDFFAMLQQAHLLDHAIVVLLSDHGEALELAGDRVTEASSFIGKAMPEFYPQGEEHEAVNQSVGHGTDVLGLTQYHTLLAFKLYGLGKSVQAALPGVVSLLDIKPTILNALSITDRHSSGQSLLPFIKTSQAMIRPRHIFLESDFSPQAIRTVYPDTRAVVFQGVQLFQLDPISTRLTVKPKMGEMILHSKQYADIYGEWMLAYYPQGQHIYIPILVNLVTGQWTNDLRSSFAQSSPFLEMKNALKQFYAQEAVF